MLQVTDGGCPNQVLGAVFRSSVRINDRRPLPREIFQQAHADRLNQRADSARVVVGVYPNQDVHLTDVDQFTKKIIRKNGFFGQEYVSLE